MQPNWPLERWPRASRPRPTSRTFQRRKLAALAALRSVGRSCASRPVAMSHWLNVQSVGLNVSTWVLVAVAAALVHWIRWRSSRFVRLIEAVPGPRGLPLVGNAVQLAVDKTQFLRIVHGQWVDQFGPIYRGWGGDRPIVCVSSPELIEPILSSSKMMGKSVEYTYLSPWLGNCMFLTTGARWKSRRRLLTPAFHFQILESFFDVFNEQSHRLADQLSAAVDASGGAELDVYPFLTRAALDIICETSMGKRQQGAKDDISDYLKSVNRITQIVMERGVRPWLKSDWTFRWSSLGRQNQECVDVLHSFTNQVIRQRRQMLQQDDGKDQPDAARKRLAFLDLLIRASNNGADLSDEDIREEVDTATFAGYDTTATGMGWFLYCMAAHPHEQQLVYDEVNEAFGDSDRHCIPQDLPQLKYLECCIKETLRLYPSIPAVLRNLSEDVDIGGYTLPAGLSVAVLIYGMHHSPKVYSDPDEFKPERFLPENSVGRHPYAFIPFSAGLRNCIGQKYGMLELKVVLSTLIRRFHFSIDEATRARTVASSEIVLKPVNGIRLIITPRSPRVSA